MKRLLFLILLLPCLVYGQTVGIKVASPIIKNSPSDNTVTGYADLLNGGYHITPTISGRDSLNTAYSKTLKTGMLCYVTGVDSTYRWSGTDWTAVLSGGITPEILSDSLSNYTPLQDGLIIGGSATIGTSSVTIDTAYYRINKVNYMSLPRTFTGISNSASGTQYYILIYGKNDNTLDTLQGVQGTIATIPTKPVGTVSINTVLVGDSGVESSSPDLTSYVTTDTKQTITGEKLFTSTIFNSKNRGMWFFGDNSYQTGISSTRNIIGNASTDGEKLYLQTNGIPQLHVFKNGNVAIKSFSLNDLGYKLSVDGDVNITGTYRVNGTPIGGGGVTSITAGLGLTGGTITTSGTIAVDTTAIRTVTNSYSLSTGQPRLVSGTNIKTVNSTSLLGSGNLATELPLTFSTPLSRSTNTISIPVATTSVNGYLSSTDWTTFNNKQSTISFGTIGSTPNANGASISSGVITLQPASASPSYGGVITTGTQSFAGNKTFTGTVQTGNFSAGGIPSSSTWMNLLASSTTVSPLRIPYSSLSPTTPVSGDWWSLTTGLRTQTYDGTQTKDVIFDKANSVFAGLGTGMIATNNSGDLSVLPIADRLTTNVITKTANYTVTLSDVGANGEVLVMADATSGNITITLPVASTSTGLNFIVKKTDLSANTVTVSVASTIDGTSTKVYNTQYSGSRITSNGTTYSITGGF